MINPCSSIIPSLESALAARSRLFDERHEAALRLFNGFFEGCPDLVVDVYARTLVLFNYTEHPDELAEGVQTALHFYQERLPWLQAAVVKTRRSTDLKDRRGVLVYGERVDNRIRERGVLYAVELLLNQDASLYLDTRNLRLWARENLAGKTVLNTFAYTGSLGVAAMAGGAGRTVHLDLSRTFLNVAKRSYTLNGFPIQTADFRVGDFFPLMSRIKRGGERFDCVFLDPPFFSTTQKGRVDLVNESSRLINKVRPLIQDGGILVAINNALFLSGRDYLRSLEALSADGYLSIESLIPVPPDCTGFPETVVALPPADPAPFNHPTKIAVLRVKRKDG